MSGEENSPDDAEQPMDQPEPAGQPPQQPDQPMGQPQAQPGGPAAPAQGQQPVGQGPSLVDELQRPESMHWIKFNVALFAVFGLGYSLAFFLFDALSSSGEIVSSGLLAVVFVMGLFLAPLLATITGLRIGQRFIDERNLVLANSFIGAAAGFLVMFFLMFVFVWSQVSSGSGGNLGDMLAPIIGYTIGVGLTGLLATYVVRWFDGR